MRDSRRTSTLKIRPWSQLPGVVAYLVLDADEQVTDAWGQSPPDGLLRAAAFRERVKRGKFDASHLLETCSPARVEVHALGVGPQNAREKKDESIRILSVVRRDGWFVHVWLEGPSDVAGILSIVGG